MTHPGQRDTADDFGEVRQRDMTTVMAYLKVLAIVKPETENIAAAPSLTTFGVHMETINIVLEQLEIVQGTC